MWQLANLTPYKAARTWFADKEGRNHWSVAVKGTFVIEPDGTAVVAAKQEDILYMPAYFAEAGTSSPQWESDLTGPKASTDVLVTGFAYAPSGRPVEAVDVSLRLGSRIDKTVRVHGNRWWTAGIAGPRITRTEAFVSMPMKYEMAFGGADLEGDDPRAHRLEERNPVGTGFAVRSSSILGKRLPNIEHPSSLIRSWNDRPVPTGFGPIACDWSPRRELAGTYDDTWRERRFPLWADDFNTRYFQAAPADQQVQGRLRGGEMGEITNMTPDGAWRFTVPKTYLSFETAFGRERVRHHGTIATVTLDPDRRLVIVSWQTFLSCHHRADELDSTVIREKPYLQLGN